MSSYKALCQGKQGVPDNLSSVVNTLSPGHVPTERAEVNDIEMGEGIFFGSARYTIPPNPPKESR